jgi:hypothetical protein
MCLSHFRILIEIPVRIRKSVNWNKNAGWLNASASTNMLASVDALALIPQEHFPRGVHPASQQYRIVKTVTFIIKAGPPVGVPENNKTRRQTWQMIL